MSCIVRTRKNFWWTLPVLWELNGIEAIRFVLFGPYPNGWLWAAAGKRKGKDVRLDISTISLQSYILAACDECVHMPQTLFPAVLLQWGHWCSLNLWQNVTLRWYIGLGLHIPSMVALIYIMRYPIEHSGITVMMKAWDTKSRSLLVI